MIKDCLKINDLTEKVKQHEETIEVLKNVKDNNEIKKMNSNLDQLNERIQKLEKKATDNGWDNQDEMQEKVDSDADG